MISNHNHWVCVVGGLYIKNEDVCLFDSMIRWEVDRQLGQQLKELYPKDSRKNRNKIVVRIQRTQKQKSDLCGFFACAFATALCFQQDPERIEFNVDELCAHFVKCLKNQTIEMFPHREKTRVNNTERMQLEYLC